MCMWTCQTDFYSRIVINSIKCTFGRTHERISSKWRLKNQCPNRNVRLGFSLWDQDVILYRLVDGFFELQVQTQPANFIIQHVKAGGCTSLQSVFAFDHALVDFGTTFDVVALHC